MAFAGILRQSTAVDVLIGPFVDSTDGDSEESGLTIAQADVRLSKNGQSAAQKNDNTSCAHDADGFYNCELDAADTNTVGQLSLYVHVAGALAVRHDFQVIEEAVYDIMFAASATGAVPVASIANNAITAAAIATGAIDADAIADNAIDAGAIASNALTAAKFASDAITAAKVASDVGTEIATAVWANGTRVLTAGTNIALAKGTGVTGFNDLSAAQVNAEVDTALADYDGPTNAEMVARTLASADYATASALQTVDDEIATIDSNVDAILEDTGTTLPGTLTTIDSVVDGIAVQTTRVDGLIEDSTGDRFTEKALEQAPSGGGGSAPTVGEIADAVWDEDLTGHVTADTAGAILGDVATGTPPTADAIADEVQTRTIAAVTLVNGLAANVVTASALAADAVTEIQSGLATAAALATVDQNVDAILVDTAEIGAAGAGLTEAGGTGDHLSALASAAALATVDNNVDAVLVDTGTTLPASLAAIEADTQDLQAQIGTDGAGLTALGDTRIANLDAAVSTRSTLTQAQVATELSDALTVDVVADSVPADGSRPTIAQALYILTQYMTERAVVGTTMTIKKPDGSTSLITLTLDDATTPTSVTRAS